MDKTVPIQTRVTTPGAGNWAPLVAKLSDYARSELQSLVGRRGIEAEDFGPLSQQVQSFIGKGIIPQDPTLQRRFYALALGSGSHELAFELARGCPAIDRVVLWGELPNTAFAPLLTQLHQLPGITSVEVIGTLDLQCEQGIAFALQSGQLVTLKLSSFTNAGGIGNALAHNTSLTTLGIRSAGIEPADIASVAHAVKNNKQLETLSLEHDNNANTLAKPLFEAIRDSPSLQTLKLSCASQSGEHSQLLETALFSQSLKRFDYSSSAADCAHALEFITLIPGSTKHLCVLPTTRPPAHGSAYGANAIQLVQKNQKLETLQLTNAFISDSNVDQLAAAIRQHTQLHALILSGGKDYSPEQERVLVAAMRNNSSLQIFHVGAPLAAAPDPSMARSFANLAFQGISVLEENEEGAVGKAVEVTDRLNARLEEIGISKRVYGRSLGPALVRMNTGSTPSDWNLGAHLSPVDMAHLRATCTEMHDLDKADIALQNSGRTLSQVLRILRERDPEGLSALLRERGVKSFGALGLAPQDLETLQIIVGSSEDLAEVLQYAENQARF